MVASLVITYAGTAHSFAMYANILGGYLSSLSALVFLCSLMGVLAIAKKWPGLLSICAWFTEVTAHFFCVMLYVIVTASWNAGIGSAYLTLIQFAFLGIGRERALRAPPLSRAAAPLSLT